MRKQWAYALAACAWLSSAVLSAQSAFGLNEPDTPPTPSVVNVCSEDKAEPQLSIQREVVPTEVKAIYASEKEEGTSSLNAIDNSKNHQKIADLLEDSFEHGLQTSIKYEVPQPEPSRPQGRELQVTAYAYCLQGRTASGAYTGPGCIAVDPSVIPIGTRIYVPGYGWGKAMDTGGGIYGNKIDIWLPSGYECSKWGVRNVTVTIAQ